jgi:hypothetical protein
VLSVSGVVKDGDCTASMCITQLRPVVHFSWVKGSLAKVIRNDMFPVYSVNCLLQKAVNWTKKFTKGHSKWKTCLDRFSKPFA